MVGAANVCAVDGKGKETLNKEGATHASSIWAWKYASIFYFLFFSTAEVVA